jgi:hypothetical protein
MSRPTSRSGSSASSALASADTLSLASAAKLIPDNSVFDEIASATLPGEILDLHSLRPAANHEYVSSPNGGSAESVESLDEDEDEVHDFLEKVQTQQKAI